MNMEKKLVSELNKGDIFSFGNNVWDMQHRLEKIVFYSDKKECWINEWEDGCRICFWISSIFGDGTYRGVLKWSDTNSLEQVVYIPQYPMSAHKKTKDKYCIPHGNQRHIFRFELNPINKSNSYCSNN